MTENFKHTEITNLIIKGFYNVYNQLGYGFLEKVYENALVVELRKLGLICVPQYPVEIYYDEVKVGFYIADMMINSCVIVEVKAAEAICEEHEAQLTNYLRATDIEVGLLLNFGRKAGVKRKVFSDGFKNHNIS